MPNSAPIKTLLLSGNLKNNISLKLYPVSDFNQGRWNMCVTQLIYHIKQDAVDEICGISTNLIKGTKFTAENEIQTIFQPLNLFLIQGKKNQKKTINFEKIWSLVNNFSEELKIFIRSLPTDNILNIDCEIYILILMQRIV
jgi:hypothetical protein